MDFIDISEVQELVQDEKAFLNIDAFFAGYATQIYGGIGSLELIVYEMVTIIESLDGKHMKPNEKLNDFIDFLLTFAGDEFKASLMKESSDNPRPEEIPKEMLLKYFQKVETKIENDKAVSKVGLYCIGYFLAKNPDFPSNRVLGILQNVEKNLPKELNFQRAKKLFESLEPELSCLQREEEKTNRVQKEKVKTEKPVKKKKSKDVELEGKPQKVEKNKKKKQPDEEKPKPKSNKKEHKKDDDKKKKAKPEKEQKTKKKKVEINLERSFGGIPLVDSFVISQPTFQNKTQIQTQQEFHFEEPCSKKPNIFEISLNNISLVTSHVIPQQRIQKPPEIPNNFPKRMELESPIREEINIESLNSSVHTSIMNLEPDKEINEEEEEELPLKNSYSGDQQQLSNFRVPEWQFDTPKRHIIKDESFQTSQKNFLNFFGLFDRFFCSRRKKPSTTNKDLNNNTSTPTSQQPFITPFKQDESFVSLTPKDTQTKDYQFGTQVTKTTMNDSNELWSLCSICQKRVLAEETSHGFQSCGHKFCRNCLEDLKGTFQNLVQIRDLPLICPSKTCSKTLCLMDVMDILNDWTLEIYIKCTLDHYIDENKDMRCCPTPGCMYAFLPIMGNNNYFKCVKCEKAYCLECCTQWHQGKTCSQKKKPSTKTLKMKECPKCSVWVQKKAGEKYLQCKNCKEKFCYDCGKGRKKDYCPCYGDLNLKPIVSPELFHQIMNTCQEDINLIENQKEKLIPIPISNPIKFKFETNISNDEIKKFIKENSQILKELGSDCSNDISYQGSLEEFDSI